MPNIWRNCKWSYRTISSADFTCFISSAHRVHFFLVSQQSHVSGALCLRSSFYILCMWRHLECGLRIDLKSKVWTLDGLSISFHILSFVIHRFSNYIFTSSTFHTAWQQAKTLPISKKKNTILPSDFRPISILSTKSKAIEKMIDEQ